MQEMELGTAVEKARGVDLLKVAAQRRAERESHLFCAVPSWDGDLIGEYRLIPTDEMEKIAQRVARRMRQDGGRNPLWGDIAIITNSCVGLYTRDPETGERVPIEDEFGLVGYDRIAEVLGKEDEIKSNADAVRYLTGERAEDGEGWQENAAAINRHAARIQQWMSDPSRRSVDLQDLLSELV